MLIIIKTLTLEETLSWQILSCHPTLTSFANIGLAAKWLRILSLGGIDKSHNHLVADLILHKLVVDFDFFWT